MGFKAATKRLPSLRKRTTGGTTEFSHIANRSATLQSYTTPWSAAHDATVATTNEPTFTTPGAGELSGYFVYRAFIAFNISGLPGGAIIQSAKVKFTAASVVGAPSVAVVAGNQSNPIVSEDFDVCGLTKFSGDHTIVSGANQISLNATGIAALQSAILSGVALLCLREVPHDIDNVAPGVGTYFYADWNESVNKLEITYEI